MMEFTFVDFMNSVIIKTGFSLICSSVFSALNKTECASLLKLNGVFWITEDFLKFISHLRNKLEESGVIKVLDKMVDLLDKIDKIMNKNPLPSKTKLTPSIPTTGDITSFIVNIKDFIC